MSEKYKFELNDEQMEQVAGGAFIPGSVQCEHGLWQPSENCPANCSWKNGLGECDYYISFGSLALG